MKANLGVTRAQTAHLSCAYCYRRSAQLLSKCTKCKRVAYCDKDCQKKDWKDHKGNCQQLQKVNAYDLKKGHTLLSASNRLQYYVSEEVMSTQRLRSAFHSHFISNLVVKFISAPPQIPTVASPIS
jgi:hypothetical protein